MIVLNYILLVAILGSRPAAPDHAVKISTGEMIYYRERKEFVIKLRFFADDFVASVNQKLHTKIDHVDPGANAATSFDAFIRPYFSLQINDQPAKPIYRKISREDQVIIMEYVLPYAQANYISTIKIYYPILMDFFTDQQNLFRVDLLNDGNMTTYRYNSKEQLLKKTFNQKIF